MAFKLKGVSDHVRLQLLLGLSQWFDILARHDGVQNSYTHNVNQSSIVSRASPGLPILMFSKATPRLKLTLAKPKSPWHTIRQ